MSVTLISVKGMWKDAAEISYQAFFFDNTTEDEPFKLVGHFKNVKGIKKWDADHKK